MDDSTPRQPIDRERRARAFAKLESTQRREAFALSPDARLEILETLAALADLGAAHRIPHAEGILRERSRRSLLAWKRRA